MSKQPTVCGVQVHTWGTAYDGGQGIWSQIKTKLYGGNVGHASMTLTIPDNDDMENLIHQYCVNKDGKTIIPYNKRVITFADGTTESVYMIYFSVWPSYGRGEVFLYDTINKDQLSYLNGVDFKWNDKYKKIYKPEQRIVKGMVGQRKQFVGPVTIEHYGEVNSMSKLQHSIIKRMSENYRLDFIIKGIETLESKIKKNINNKHMELSASNKLLIYNVMNDEGFLSPSKNALSHDDMNEMLKKLKIKKNSLNKRKTKNLTYLNKASKDHGNRYDRYLSARLQSEGEGSVSLPISNNVAARSSVNNGLNIEAMLSKMHDLVTNNIPFSLYDKNCSESIAQVLEAGVQQQHLKSIVAERTIFGMNTPQMVYNAALKLQKGIMHNEQTNIWHRLKVFNPSVPIEMVIKSLIVFGRSNYIFIPIVLVILMPLFIFLAVVKAITYPFNMLGAFMGKEARVNIVDNKDNNADLDAAGLSAQRNKQALEQELKERIEPRIKEINVIDPIAAILEFASDLEDNDAIPVFSNKSVDKLKKYMHKHNDTPEDLVVKIKQLNLGFPKKVNYKDLSDLVDALQLLAAKRVTDSVATLHDTIKNRKTTETTQFTGDAIKTKDSISSEDPANKTTNKPDQS